MVVYKYPLVVYKYPLVVYKYPLRIVGTRYQYKSSFRQSRRYLAYYWYFCILTIPIGCVKWILSYTVYSGPLGTTQYSIFNSSRSDTYDTSYTAQWSVFGTCTIHRKRENNTQQKCSRVEWSPYISCFFSSCGFQLFYNYLFHFSDLGLGYFLFGLLWLARIG